MATAKKEGNTEETRIAESLPVNVSEESAGIPASENKPKEQPEDLPGTSQEGLQLQDQPIK